MFLRRWTFSSESAVAWSGFLERREEFRIWRSHSFKEFDEEVHIPLACDLGSIREFSGESLPAWNEQRKETSNERPRRCRRVGGSLNFSKMPFQALDLSSLSSLFIPGAVLAGRKCPGFPQGKRTTRPLADLGI